MTGGRDGKLMLWHVRLDDPHPLVDIAPTLTKDTKQVGPGAALRVGLFLCRQPVSWPRTNPARL